MTTKESAALPRTLSLWTGSGLIVLGATVAVISVVQYRAVLRTLKPVEIPDGYWINTGVVTNLLLAVIGLVITSYFFHGLG